MYIALWSNFGFRMLRHCRIGPRWNSLPDAVRRRTRRTPLPFPFHYRVTENIQFPHVLSHAVKIPGLVFCSGQVPMTKEGKLVEGGIAEHTEQCIKNLGNVLAAAGSSWEKVVKVNIYLKSMDDYPEMNTVYERLLPTPKPARTCIQAAKLPADCRIEIECIAAV